MKKSLKYNGSHYTMLLSAIHGYTFIISIASCDNPRICHITLILNIYIYIYKKILDRIHYQIVNSWHDPIECVRITKSSVPNLKFLFS